MRTKSRIHAKYVRNTSFSPQILLPFNDCHLSLQILHDKHLIQQTKDAHLVFQSIVSLYKYRELHLLDNLSQIPLSARKAIQFGDSLLIRTWEQYPIFLAIYRQICIAECKSRRISTAFLFSIYSPDSLEFLSSSKNTATPPFWGVKEFHDWQKSLLLRKDHDYYQPLVGYDVPANLPLPIKLFQECN